MWINTWVTLIVMMTWIVAGLVVTQADPGWSVTAGAVVIAVVLPVIFYPYAKSLMLSLLFRIDPPPTGCVDVEPC